MKRIFVLSWLIAILLLPAAVAGGQAGLPLYKQTAGFKVGGEGGWDYITYDPGANRLYIAHGSEVVVLDAGSGAKVGTVPANGAHGVAIVAEKKLGFSSNGRAGTVTVFDAQTLQPRQDIKAGKNPDAIIYDPHSKKVIVMNGRSQDLMAIDPDSLKVIATVPLGGKLEFAAADASRVYVNVEDTSEIAAVDTKTWKAGARWKLEGCDEPSGLALDEKTNRLFSVCGNKKMMVVDTASGEIVATLDTGAGTDGAGFDPGLGYVLASNGGDGTLTVVKSGGGKYVVAAQVPTQRGARTLAVDPASHRVFLPAAEFGPPAEGQKRPSIKPGTFTVLVFEPAK
jgi:YVTN family beta-propeller protein